MEKELKRRISSTAVWIISAFLVLVPPATAGETAPWDFRQLETLIGSGDSILFTDSHGKIIFAKNATIPRIPASTLKLLTALAALHTLGPDYRFVTDFYLDEDSNLKIKGFGDPLMISETISLIAEGIGNRTGGGIEDIQ